MYNRLRHKTTSGHLCRGAYGHLAADCGPVPESCVSDLPQRYRLLEVDALTSCPLCLAGSGGRAWDGTFQKVSPTACLWTPQNEDGYGAAEGQTLRIGAGVLALTAIDLMTGADHHWLLYFHCETEDSLVPIWFGRKDSGQTPLGRYTRMLGWLTSSTLTIH